MINHLSIKSSGYRYNIKELHKVYFDLVELMMVGITFPLSIWVMKALFLQDIKIKTGTTLFSFSLILMSWFVISRMMALSKIPRAHRYTTHILQFARFTFIVFLGLVTVKILFRLTSIPVLLIVTYVSIMFVFTLLFRLFTFKYLNVYRSFGLNAHRVLIIADAFSDGIIETLMIQKEWGFSIQSIVTDSRLIIAKYGSLFQIHPVGDGLRNIIDRGIIDEVIYCKRDIEVDLIREAADLCNEIGIIFRLQSSVSPLEPTQFQLKTLGNRKDILLVDIPSSGLPLVLKNMADIYFSILALIFLLPFFAIIAIFIKIGSMGPVIFTQQRIGRRGRKFKLYKFRTMVLDAEKQLNILSVIDEANGPVFKIKHDPRITWIGLFLRKTGLDELPQLINVVKGEMSLIGPRPPLEEEVNQYERWQLRRLSVKPGITCSWQVVPDRHDVSFEEWMKLDLQYIDNWNLGKDLVLFIRTIGTFFRARGY